MSRLMIALLIILAVLVVVLIVLYFWGKKLQKKQDESQAQMEATKQTVQIFVIDKKMLPLKQSGLPQVVIDQRSRSEKKSRQPSAASTSWMSRRSAASWKHRPRRRNGISGSASGNEYCIPV